MWPHPNGQWAKKIRGRVHYFGLWDDWRAALNKYLDQVDDLQLGKKPRAKTEKEGVTVKYLLDHFHEHKKQAMEQGDISERTFAVYFDICTRIRDKFGRDRLVDDLDMRALQDQRAKEEQAAQAQRDNSLWRPGMIGDDIERRRRQFERNQQAAAQRGRRSAFNDAENGNLDQGEVEQAQAAVSGQMIAAQAKQGNISGLQAKGLFDAVKSIADQQVQLDEINRMLQQLGQGQKGLNAATQAAARNMASQVGGLGN